MTFQWKIHLFAGLAERFGQPAVTLELDSGELQVQALKEALIGRFPELEALIRVSFIASNHAYAADGETVSASSELALLPPVSGGEEDGSDAGRYVVTTEPLSVEAVTALVIVPEHGASLTFTGTTREWTQGQRTVRLEYEAYVPMAEKMLRQIGEELGSRWPGALCAIAHRIGLVDIAEISVVIAVSAPHRDACYEASRYAIERLKQVVPIWKKEVWEDGSEWKGHQQGPWNPAAPLHP
ncbi:molybdenum cofactor biosynthesis protein [Paenibacillus humicola]|uniref:molybdenum cofactor biosynthesis protein n=1 Tax=Paenibacillus humicola TaxID=3110540 RepID=UPI00237B3095|nr:molybdenum cofactor biosynthesis protein MoaE [Paenibacillus humicola]